jgi:hypothetical protein
MNDKKMYVCFQVTVQSEKYDYKAPKGTAELEIETLPNVLDHLDAAGLLATLLPTALADYQSQTEEKEGQE